jgi:lycopene beta-cyclase
VLVGGGLANGLLAWRLLTVRPDISFAILEAGPTLGGNHTWSFHGTDVTKAQLEWLWVLVTKSWPSHDVIFSGEPRRLGGGYHSITSHDFHWKLAAQLGDRLRTRAPVKDVGATHVVLGSGERLEARAVIDGRGFSQAPPWPCGYQKFLGLDVELERPHALEVPLLMDGRVPQLGAFRFLYLLPWDERRLLVEDTAYADDARLDLPALRARITEYLKGLGLTVKRVVREEAAALPIPLSGEPPRLTRPVVGVAAGLFHATTGYSLPMAVDVADALPRLSDLSAPALTRWLEAHARRHWAQQGFFRLLNRMLFRGAEPDARVRIFDSFYRHDEATIARFYAGTLTAMDKLAILARGSTTVRGLRAVKAAMGTGRA